MMPETNVAVRLSEIDHFRDLSDPFLAELVSGSEFRSYAKDDEILTPDRPYAGFSFLVRGSWWMSRSLVGTNSPFEWSDDRPGNWHGGIPLFDAIAPVRVLARTACDVLHVPRELLDSIAARNAHLALAMLRGVQGGSTVLFKHAHDGEAENAPSGPAMGLTT